MADVVSEWVAAGESECSHLPLGPSPPGIGEDGADDALGAGVAWRGHFRHAAVWLAGVIGLGLWVRQAQVKIVKKKVSLYIYMEVRYNTKDKQIQ